MRKLLVLSLLSYSSNITAIEDAFGVTHSQSGLVTTCFFIAYGIGQIVNGIVDATSSVATTYFIESVPEASIVEYERPGSSELLSVYRIYGTCQLNDWITAMRPCFDLAEENSMKLDFWTSGGYFPVTIFVSEVGDNGS